MSQLVGRVPGFIFVPPFSSGFFSSWKNLRKKPGLARTSETALGGRPPDPFAARSLLAILPTSSRRRPLLLCDSSVHDALTDAGESSALRVRLASNAGKDRVIPPASSPPTLASPSPPSLPAGSPSSWPSSPGCTSPAGTLMPSLPPSPSQISPLLNTSDLPLIRLQAIWQDAQTRAILSGLLEKSTGNV